MYSGGSDGVPVAQTKKVTVPELRARKHGGPPLAMVTAYDFTMARLVDEAGVDSFSWAIRWVWWCRACRTPCP